MRTIEFDEIEFDGETAKLLLNSETQDEIDLDELVRDWIRKTNQKTKENKKGLYFKEVF